MADQTQFLELALWMLKNGKTVRGLAADAGLDKMTVQRLLKGQVKRLDPDFIPKITKATGGRVAEKQWAAYLARLQANRLKTGKRRVA